MGAGGPRGCRNTRGGHLGGFFDPGLRFSFFWGALTQRRRPHWTQRPRWRRFWPATDWCAGCPSTCSGGPASPGLSHSGTRKGLQGRPARRPRREGAVYAVRLAVRWDVLVLESHAAFERAHLVLGVIVVKPATRSPAVGFPRGVTGGQGLLRMTMCHVHEDFTDVGLHSRARCGTEAQSPALWVLGPPCPLGALSPEEEPQDVRPMP